MVLPLNFIQILQQPITLQKIFLYYFLLVLFDLYWSYNQSQYLSILENFIYIIIFITALYDQIIDLRLNLQCKYKVHMRPHWIWYFMTQSQIAQVLFQSCDILRIRFVIIVTVVQVNGTSDFAQLIVGWFRLTINTLIFDSTIVVLAKFIRQKLLKIMQYLIAGDAGGMGFCNLGQECLEMRKTLVLVVE